MNPSDQTKPQKQQQSKIVSRSMKEQKKMGSSEVEAEKRHVSAKR